MKITSAEFVKSAVWPTQYPEATMPEIAFAGRSNVGKSSLINTPGRTLQSFPPSKTISWVD
jgi:GTP-binding protein